MGLLNCLKYERCWALAMRWEKAALLVHNKQYMLDWTHSQTQICRLRILKALR